MPDRKSKNSKEEKPVNCLRRSPRLHRKTQVSTQNPKTPKPAETRRRRPISFSTPLTEIKKTSHGVLKNGGARESRPNSEKSGNGCRRSARVQHGANFSSPCLEKQYAKEKLQTRSPVGMCQSGKGSERSVEGSRRSERRDRRAIVDKSDAFVIEKRMTRSSVRRNKVLVYEISDSDSEEDSGESVVNVSKKPKNKSGVDKEKNIVGIEERVTHSSCKTNVKKAGSTSNSSRRKAVMSDEVEAKGDDELSKIDTSKNDVKDCGDVRGNEEHHCTRKSQIGEKRKRNRVDEECETAQGWNKEQELALQRAYFTAKPTPQFWKKVSRMVPGKTAAECFDRIHSDHLTPPQPRTRSRAKIKESSPLSFSASNLLNPAVTKSKRLGFRRKTLLAQKTVRHILQKQQKEDQDYNADLFALFEPTISPVPVKEGAKFVSSALDKASPILTGCRQMSSSSQRKHASSLDSLQKAAFTSPPVLKQIKNKALHEKYIDQLHCRDAKRKAEALRNSRNAKDKTDEKVNCLKHNLVKVAKDALASDAQDAISKFQSLLSSVGDNDCCSDDDGNEEDEDDDDGVR